MGMFPCQLLLLFCCLFVYLSVTVSGITMLMMRTLTPNMEIEKICFSSAADSPRANKALAGHSSLALPTILKNLTHEKEVSKK